MEFERNACMLHSRTMHSYSIVCILYAVPQDCEKPIPPPLDVMQMTFQSKTCMPHPHIMHYYCSICTIARLLHYSMVYSIHVYIRHNQRGTFYCYSATPDAPSAGSERSTAPPAHASQMIADSIRRMPPPRRAFSEQQYNSFLSI